MTPDPLVSYTIDTSEIDRFVERFPRSGPAIAERELRTATIDALEYTVGQVADRTPVNTGILRASIYSEIVGVHVDLARGIDVEGVVSSSDYEPKVLAVEFGRKPGKMPPVEAIALWARRRGLAGTYSIKTKKRIGSKAQQGKEELDAAWGFAKHIAVHGTKANRMFAEGAAASEAFIFKQFDEATDRITNGYAQI